MPRQRGRQTIPAVFDAEIIGKHKRTAAAFDGTQLALLDCCIQRGSSGAGDPA
jgi:hypothetical protein